MVGGPLSPHPANSSLTGLAKHAVYIHKRRKWKIRQQLFLRVLNRKRQTGHSHYYDNPAKYSGVWPCHWAIDQPIWRALCRTADTLLWWKWWYLWPGSDSVLGLCFSNWHVWDKCLSALVANLVSGTSLMFISAVRRWGCTVPTLFLESITMHTFIYSPNPY